MCDYSLEMYGSRPAREGERYITKRFPSGPTGGASSDNAATPVCIACDTRLMLENIPANIGKRFGVGKAAEVVFTRLDAGTYRDGVRFSSGEVVSLQQLPPGIGVSVVENLDKPITLTRVLENVWR